MGYKVFVTGIHIVIVNTEEPIEGVVHNGIAVAGHRVFSAKQPDGTLHGFIIEEQIVVHQVALDGIATPYPTVALDAVDKEFTGSKAWCMLLLPRCGSALRHCI